MQINFSREEILSIMISVDIAIASDHGGYELKEVLKEYLKSNNYNVKDFGCHSRESVDYPEYAEKCCNHVLSGRDCLGVLICGSGIGMSITANKIKGIRAALCTSEYHARLSREHNNANVLCLGARYTAGDYAMRILDAFLISKFEGGRHIKRLNRIKEIETKGSGNCK